MHHSRMKSLAIEIFTQSVCDGNRTMSTSCAANRHRDITLALALIERHQIIEQVIETEDRFTHLLTPAEIIDDRLIVAVHVFQLRNKMRVGQKANIEHKICIERHTIFKSET